MSSFSWRSRTGLIDSQLLRASGAPVAVPDSRCGNGLLDFPCEPGPNESSASPPAACSAVPTLRPSGTPAGPHSDPRTRPAPQLRPVLLVASNPNIPAHQTRQRVSQVDQIEVVCQRALWSPSLGDQRSHCKVVRNLACGFARPATAADSVIEPFEQAVRGQAVAPCRPLLVTSPAAHSLGSDVRPSPSTVSPPIM